MRRFCFDTSTTRTGAVKRCTVSQEGTEETERLRIGAVGGAALVICAGQDESVHSIDELERMEIDQQPHGHIKQLHVAQELGFVNRKDGLHGFDLDEGTTCNEHIEPERLVAGETLVRDSNQTLILGGEMSEFQFAQEAPLVDRLHQARALVFVNFDCGPDYLLGESAGFVEQGVHPDSVYSVPSCKTIRGL